MTTQPNHTISFTLPKDPMMQMWIDNFTAYHCDAPLNLNTEPKTCWFNQFGMNNVVRHPILDKVKDDLNEHFKQLKFKRQHITNKPIEHVVDFKWIKSLSNDDLKNRIKEVNKDTNLFGHKTSFGINTFLELAKEYQARYTAGTMEDTLMIHTEDYGFITLGTYLLFGKADTVIQPEDEPDVARSKFYMIATNKSVAEPEKEQLPDNDRYWLALKNSRNYKRN